MEIFQVYVFHGFVKLIKTYILPQGPIFTDSGQCRAHATKPTKKRFQLNAMEIWNIFFFSKKKYTYSDILARLSFERYLNMCMMTSSYRFSMPSASFDSDDLGHDFVGSCNLTLDFFGSRHPSSSSSNGLLLLASMSCGRQKNFYSALTATARVAA